MRPMFLFFVSFVTLFPSELFGQDRSASVCYRTAASLAAALEEGGHDGAQFDFEATVVLPGYKREDTIAVADETGAVTLLANWSIKDRRTVVAGDRVRVRGNLGHDASYETSAGCSELVRLGKDKPPQLPLADAARLFAGGYGHQPVRVKGRIRSADRDELDPGFNLLALVYGDSYIHLSFRCESDDAAFLDALVDAEVEAVGFCHNTSPGRRPFIRCFVQMSGRSGITILRPGPDNPLDMPGISSLVHALPEELARKERHAVRGTVLAVWQRRNLLVRSKDGFLTGVELQAEPAPACGASIVAGGFPETDLYHLNLTRAVWKPDRAPPPAAAVTLPESVAAPTLLTDENGRTMLKAEYHGRLIRLKGIVRDLPGRGEAQDRIVLDCDSFPINVFTPPEAFPDLAIGTTVTVTGFCLLHTRNRSAADPLPCADSFQIALRSPDDLEVVSRPPWWTPARLLVILAVLVALLFGVLVWNFALRRLVDRRSRALLKEQIAHIGADLRVEERTRLAVELHDSLSQTLTGVSLQLDAARRNPAADPEKARRRLDLAAETLHACRDELKDCLFDLRNLALDEPDFNAAIRKTLTPCLGDTELIVRFNVSRTRLSDATAHAVLRIVRELAANAIRHGKATHLRIAGDLTDVTLSFSVRDDGCGFDPRQMPGPAEGHFGLQGIRERIRRLNGEIAFSPVPDGGTKAVVTLHLRTEGCT